ncbi:hypothetical protein FOL47_000207 [Perkinsus chesapeaki]|uniref:Uncharacterized protein n=1 Tax=Perkinsus chesapeaki TaxID=330153 RepID=A0A7J6KX92_PERCH|nr:hypothetical protein FOL47_000207 [Perkinsus chesapeaki]
MPRTTRCANVCHDTSEEFHRYLIAAATRNGWSDNSLTSADLTDAIKLLRPGYTPLSRRRIREVKEELFRTAMNSVEDRLSRAAVSKEPGISVSIDSWTPDGHRVPMLAVAVTYMIGRQRIVDTENRDEFCTLSIGCISHMNSILCKELTGLVKRDNIVTRTGQFYPIIEYKGTRILLVAETRWASALRSMESLWDNFNQVKLLLQELREVHWGRLERCLRGRQWVLQMDPRSIPDSLATRKEMAQSTMQILKDFCYNSKELDFEECINDVLHFFLRTGPHQSYTQREIKQMHPGSYWSIFERSSPVAKYICQCCRAPAGTSSLERIFSVAKWATKTRTNISSTSIYRDTCIKWYQIQKNPPRPKKADKAKHGAKDTVSEIMSDSDDIYDGSSTTIALRGASAFSTTVLLSGFICERLDVSRPSKEAPSRSFLHGKLVQGIDQSIALRARIDVPSSSDEESISEATYPASKQRGGRGKHLRSHRKR